MTPVERYGKAILSGIIEILKLYESACCSDNSTDGFNFFGAGLVDIERSPNGHFGVFMQKFQ